MKRKSANEFPQELWSLFDRYVHGEMDRQTFLVHAAKFAIAGMTINAMFDLVKPNYALAIQVPKDEKRIKTEAVTVMSPLGNGSIKGHGVVRFCLQFPFTDHSTQLKT